MLSKRFILGLAALLLAASAGTRVYGQDHELEGAALFERADIRPYENWAQSTNPTWAAFPWNDCILQEQTAQTTLTFTATSQGTWDVATLNTNPTAITVEFFPA